MRYYNRKPTYSLLFVLIGLLSLVIGLKESYKSIPFNIILGLLFLFNAYIYWRPYVGLGEGKIIITNGILKEEILLNDITSLDWSEKKLKINYAHGSIIDKSSISLSILKDNDRVQFIKDLQLQIKK